MRHLHFTQSLEPLYGGGLGSSALALHRELRAGGVTSVLCSTHGGTPQFPTADTQEFCRVNPRPLYFSPELQKRAPQLVRDADVLHGHGLYVGTNFIFGREARKQHKPLVYHVQGMFEPYILNRSKWKKDLAHLFFENANINHIRLWRALTAKEAGQIRARGYKAPIVIAPNGLKISEYARPANPGAPLETPLIARLPKTKKRLLFMGRIHPKKGLHHLLSAWKRLADETKNWELVIAGPDEQGFLKEVLKLAKSLGIEKQILFTGTVTGQTKVSLLYSADLFALPSYSEGLPISLLEAMACELPVVASYACNCPQIYSAGAGWGCDPALDSVTDALRSAMRASDVERAERGRLGRELVRREYSWDNVAATILKACSAYCS